MNAHAENGPEDGQAVDTCDALVLGGGPGGAATAILLAEAGLDVVLVEKDRHPRFHVGESLLPHSLPILERLGVLEAVRGIGVYKPGAEFVSECGTKTVVFDFANQLLDGPDHAFQVRRAEFDRILFERARAVGVTTREETLAEVVSCDSERAVISLRGPDGTRLVEAGILVDASGRSTVTARLRAEKTPDPRNTSAAIFAHFRGVPRAEGPAGGNIRVHLTDPGWVWQIPLPEGMTSMGLVAPKDYMLTRKGDIESFFRGHCARHPEIARIVGNAESAVPMGATGNFSYRAAAAHGPGHIKVGDAYGFLDPIFSTGIHLALLGAVEATEAVVAARARPAERARIMARYDRNMRARLDYASWFVYRINEPVFREMFMNPRNFLGIEQAVISLLAGDFRKDWRLRSRIWLFKVIRRSVERNKASKVKAHA
ncbi:NAD(P)/FAD-dependent oxidoreductase [Paralimibaculum aggregatum]|uniref:NAD(P)/FAD-dependent oxidoreductase n=1 Tax=Paralimibaculum aggregatum TaxID=3036245 RepID=A0ABQ6LSE0_9RHOB|nr:NAD(P)/FAD-dependent oxidoreductase [Limibaculum sp. NKW23]GMG84996.1 NAD(P)/FAD-dependent oxidoreductase [Limibaculum sp. NKW23]